MRIGKLRHLIILQKLQTTKNEYGEILKSHQDIAKVWASVEPISSNEKFLQGKEGLQISHKIEIRFLKGIDNQTQILFNERKFNITSIINPLEKDERLILLAVEVER